MASRPRALTQQRAGGRESKGFAASFSSATRTTPLSTHRYALFEALFALQAAVRNAAEQSAHRKLSRRSRRAFLTRISFACLTSLTHADATARRLSTAGCS